MLKLKNQLLGSTMVAGLAAVAVIGSAPAASAQTTARTNAQAQAEAEDAAQVEEVVVVGSRLRRDTYNSPSPIQVVTREESVLAGFASTTEVLQGTAVTSGSSQINNSYGGFVTDGGPGANTLSLRGLGATRTLILLNGRRVAPAGSRGAVGSADLNVLPTAMIERIEVLKDGASSIYGSDAVAGVVNVITRNNIDGITLEAQLNAPMETDGAGKQTRYSIVGGLQGDRFHLSGSAEYYNREEITLGDREFTRCNTDYRLNRTTGAFSDYVDPLTGQRKCYPITGTGSNGVTINTIGTSSTAGVRAAGVPTTYAGTFNRFRPNSAVSTGLVGFEGVGATGLNLNIRDTFEPRILNRSLISPVEVGTAFVEGSYDLKALGNAEVYGEFLVNRRKSSQTGYRQLSLDYNKGSLLIPGNLQFSTFLGPQPTSATPTTNVGVRAFIGFGNDTSTQEVDFTKSTAGIRGDFFLPEWRYDVYASYARSHSTYVFESFLTDRLRDSLNVVAAPVGTPASLVRTGILPTGVQGSVTCAVNITNPTAGCIAAPFLTSQTIGGALPQDWKDYVFRPVTGTTVYEEKTISAGIDGPLFTLPAGQVTAFLGAEWRDASIDDSPPADSVNGNLFNLTTSAPTRGSDQVWEVFGELEIPLLANMPFAKELSLNLSGRYTDYDSYGDDTTYKAGLVYTPVSWLSVRSTYGTSYRAPALFEQFQGATSGFLNQSSDPCNNYDAPGVFANRAANCASQGLPAGFTATSGITVISSGGAGSGALAAETSKNFTAGVILQPTLPSGYGNLSFAVDYYEIEVENGVSRIGSGNILTRCYDSNPADFTADNGFCRLVDPRNATTQALTVRDSYTNVATDKVRGIDYNARWNADIGPGRVIVNLGATQFLEIYSQLFSDDPIREEKGILGSPEWTATGDVSYAWGPYRVRYGVEWIDAMDSTEFVGATGLADYVFDVDEYFTHNISAQYSMNDITITAGVRNLFDADLPPISQGAYNKVGDTVLYSGYDYVGRSAFINVSKSF